MKDGWKPYHRDSETCVRYKAIPGMEGFSHRLGGLEKDFNTSAISTNPDNHEKMTQTRQAKIDNIANFIPELNIMGDADAEVLVIGWGGTYGHLYSAVEELNAEGTKAAYIHLNYICPLPSNTEEIIRKYPKVLVCELNNGQLAGYLRTKISGVEFKQFNKIQAQPFQVSELKSAVLKTLED